MAKDEGESLSTDELTQIYLKVVMSRYREKETFQMNTKTKTGEVNDYLELRRPFGANGNIKTSKIPKLRIKTLFKDI